ncbi:MAG TPA: hypothetical protein H9694_11165 [Firmicutes bacterium]|nr:hypothetical protein [Bacillota bacterium]
MKLNNSAVSFVFDEKTGALTEAALKGRRIPFAGIGFDLGCNEQNVTKVLEYDSLLENRTWDLPRILPTKGGLETLEAASHTQTADSAAFTYHIGDLDITFTYTLLDAALKLTAAIKNTGSETAYLNTFTLLSHLDALQGVTFDYPCNTPAGEMEAEKLAPYEVVQAGLVNFATHLKADGWEMNLLFIDDVEKWNCGVYHDGNKTHVVYSASLEADLQPGASLEVGSLFVQPCDPAVSPYLQIRDFVDSLGYHPCEGGITDGVMYSCHPAGTMDSNFPMKEDLFQYADRLEGLKKMGIDHVWLLPVFDHNEDGVYHSNDQSVIDKRYGGEEGCKYYCDKAHELGMTVLFDYVPHGPAPEFPLAKEHPDWCSKRRDGSLQDEWHCVSMDYNNPGYQKYTSDLVYDHVRRFGVDGARIDCAMGGLSNWRPYNGYRPSADSVCAGVHITEAIRDGFLRGGKRSFILPENFNPIPPYYHTTDLFYGMNLYRVFVELEPKFKDAPADYARILTRWLEVEKQTTPENYHKMRFLGNHDTVSWVWQARRAVDCYGNGGAKALWAVISLIDGMPMIYHGDEDPAIYLSEGENRVEFFTKLFRDRRELIGSTNATEYLYSGNALMAFIRGEGDHRRLVLVNLSDKPQDFDLSAYPGAKSLVNDTTSGTVAPYAYDIYSL